MPAIDKAGNIVIVVFAEIVSLILEVTQVVVMGVLCQEQEVNPYPPPPHPKTSVLTISLAMLPYAITIHTTPT